MDEEDKNLDSETSTEDIEETSDTQETESEEKPKSRTAEARIDELTGEIKDLRSQLEEAKLNKTPMPESEDKISPEVQKAVSYFKNLGFVSKEDLEEKLRVVEDRNTLNSEHSQLANTYDGSDGRPKYDKSDVEKFMRERGVYDPLIAYNELHKDELLEFELKRAEENKKQKPYVEKQGLTQVNRDDDVITREKIQQWMKTPEGRVKYERNRKKILTLMQQGEL